MSAAVEVATDLQKFEMSNEIIDTFREKREIPVHFYNNKGQILIYQKEGISDNEINRLMKFVEQGIYFRESDREKLGLEKREIPDGLSDTIVIDESMVDGLAADTQEIYDQIKESSVTSLHMKKMRSRVGELFSAFESNPEAMVGLIEVLDLMKNVPGYEVEIAVKRTVVAMAMKTRGMQAQQYKEPTLLEEMTHVLMMSALFCDIGLAKLHVPREQGIDLKQLAHLRQHPLVSYLMLAHLQMDARIKRNILCQHRPLREGIAGNNFPKLNWLIQRLQEYAARFDKLTGKERLAQDIQEQIRMLRAEMPYDEDANILSVASEFASLTTEVPWRKAMTPRQAVRTIIGNSFFTHTDRIMREFLDYVAISLCDNQLILEGGDFVIVAVQAGQPAHLLRSVSHQLRGSFSKHADGATRGFGRAEDR